MFSHVLILGEVQTGVADVLIPVSLLVAVGSDTACETAAGAIGGADGSTLIGAG